MGRMTIRMADHVAAPSQGDGLSVSIPPTATLLTDTDPGMWLGCELLGRDKETDALPVDNTVSEAKEVRIPGHHGV